MIPNTFEGLPLPEGNALAASLANEAGERARCVRAAVVHLEFAAQVISMAMRMLEDERLGYRGAGVRVLHALLAREAVSAVAAKIVNDSRDFYGVMDPIQPHRTLAESALAFLGDAASPRNAAARAALRHGLGRPELAAIAWKVVGGEDVDAVLPCLAGLLEAHPELAPEAGTRFALLFADRCEEAARAVAGLPESTRRAFAATLQKHLLRVHAVKRWVACRRILLGT